MIITVITACYNSAPFIRTALESVLAQTWGGIEYLVVDGGSTDGTVDIVREYEPKFKGKMRWISERDGGLYDALNKGIKMASGDVVGILNADDFFASEQSVAHIAAAFSSGPAQGGRSLAAGASLDAVYADIRFVDQRRVEKDVRFYSSRYFRPWLARFGYLPAHPTFYCRRRVFEELGYYRTDFSIAADHELLIRFIVRGKIRCAYIPEVIIVMRMGGMSTRSLKSTWVINRENVKACRVNGVYSNWLMQMGKYLIKLPGLLCKRGY